MLKYMIFFGVLIVIGSGIGLQKYSDSRLPQYSGELSLSGLEASVKVTRDKWGIPHIEAGSELDAQRALGFVMAGDRLFQMDLLRRIVNGELSEVLGVKTLEFDVLLRKLRIRAHMNEAWKRNRYKMDSRMVALMNAFFEGVHHYMQTQPLPIEFKILGYTPRPFTIEESLGVSGYLSLSFAEGLIADPLYTDLLSRLPKEVVEKMWVREGSDKNAITKKNKTSFQIQKNEWYGNFLKAHDYFRDVLGLFHGSNSWVLAPKRSASGSALLANDPHVAFSNPGVWYEAHIKSPEYEIYGHFIPLSPFPAMGHDQNRGWAVTMSEIDDLDLYEEKINEKNQVMYKGSWVPLKQYKEIIKVRGEEDREIEIRVTPHGPLINDSKYAVPNKNIAIKWSYHHPENNIGMALYKLSRSKKLSDLDSALEYGATPGLNISWADREGNIAWRVMGKIPIRKGFKGNQILEGWSGKHEYERYFTIKENPGAVNPDSGVIVTANYRPDYNGPLPLEGYWQPSERYERIEQLLAKKEKWTLEEMMPIQNDQFVGTGAFMRDILLSEVVPKTPAQKEILKKFKQWDGASGKSSFGSALYHMWTHHLGRLALEDNLGKTGYVAFNKVADFWHFFKSFIKDKDSKLWDDSKTEFKESRADIVNASFREALKKLRSRLGEDHSKWKWGKLHTVEFEHPLGKVKPLNKVFNLGPYPAGGGYFQVDNMSTARYEDSFNVKLGASVRRLIDFKDPTMSYGILPTGNVGHFNSPFYKDQVKMFLNGNYRAQWLSVEDAKKHPHESLILKP
jgi:penicillin amidase